MSPDIGREAIEQRPVERLVLKLVENSIGILFGKSIVASANGFFDVVVHFVGRYSAAGSGFNHSYALDKYQK
jgi:hypothetical protein